MKLLIALILLAAPLLAGAQQFTVIEVDTRKERLELFLNDDAGKPFRRLDRLDAWLKSRNRQLKFAMNAGMYEPDLSPVGLFVAQGRELRALNLASLLENGAIHPAFSATSTSKHIRNGVGVRGSEAVFVISNVPVTFYELAAYFRDQLHCQDALYFDGVVSSLFAPALSRKDSTVDLGPMIGVVDLAASGETGMSAVTSRYSAAPSTWRARSGFAPVRSRVDWSPR